MQGAGRAGGERVEARRNAWAGSVAGDSEPECMSRGARTARERTRAPVAYGGPQVGGVCGALRAAVGETAWQALRHVALRCAARG